DIEDALLMLEDGRRIVEGEMPEAQIATEGVLWRRRSGGSIFRCRFFHVLQVGQLVLSWPLQTAKRNRRLKAAGVSGLKTVVWEECTRYTDGTPMVRRGRKSASFFE